MVAQRVSCDLVSRCLDLVDEYRRHHPEQREGQAHYNVLRREWPDLQHEVVGTDRNCYGDDRRLPAFLSWVERALSAEQREREEGRPGAL
ncbi:hypothetical protein LX83_001267 [Goodfellowiella coeruleoviolacea]|uniref:Uncharacterized protein n=1 Tax=Goodfellowiella coeruleoviolacea TaxID=334858 RepID=A0AAE3GBX6_9PSEU|nr:hypothetical protein [Goodfellowiella coeruleoviolacea]